jgi:hypothetical protein
MLIASRALPFETPTQTIVEQVDGAIDRAARAHDQPPRSRVASATAGRSKRQGRDSGARGRRR